jgi:hypothetical protein
MYHWSGRLSEVRRRPEVCGGRVAPTSAHGVTDFVLETETPRVLWPEPETFTLNPYPVRLYRQQDSPDVPSRGAASRVENETGSWGLNVRALDWRG